MKIRTLVIVGSIGIGVLAVRHTRGSAAAPSVEEPAAAPVRDARALVQVGRAVRAAPVLPRLDVETVVAQIRNDEMDEFLEEIEVIGHHVAEYGRASGDVVAVQSPEGITIDHVYIRNIHIPTEGFTADDYTRHIPTGRT